MADFYSNMAGVAANLLKPTSQNGLGQGHIVLSRTTGGIFDPSNPWGGGEGTTQSETLNGAVNGISSRLVGTEAGGTVLRTTDRVAVCAVPKMQYQAGDVLSIDGVPVTILAVQNIPAAGTPSAVKFTIRG